MLKNHQPPRVLLFSQRNIFPKALFRCALYEFENIISQIDYVDVIAPQIDVSSLRYTLAKRFAYHAPAVVKPDRRIKLPADARYDLFFAVCGAPADLLNLSILPNWADACRTSVCLIDELWAKQIYEHRHFLQILGRFDIVMLYYSQSVRPLESLSGRPCVFVPPGVDTLLFCPYPELPKRVIDVLSIGRRAEVTHQSLLNLVSQEQLFYLHDTIGGDQAINSSEHRTLFANLMKRSRYFLVNPGLVNRPDIRGTQIEVSNRYFEGAAAGVIMVGERPNNDVFEGLFEWPDAVIELPYNSPEVGRVLSMLDRQPERVERMRRTNVAQALLRHDWAYRWEVILRAARLEPTQALMDRKHRLKRLADTLLAPEAEETAEGSAMQRL